VTFRIATSLRVALLAALLALGSNLALILFVHLRTHDDAMSMLRQRVAEEASALADVYDSGGRAALNDALSDLLETDPQFLGGLVDGHGRGRSGNVRSLPAPPARLRRGYQEGLIDPVRGAAPIVAGFVLKPLPHSLWLVNGRSFGERLALQRTLERALLLAGVLSVLLGLLCGLVTARYVSRSVGGIAAVAEGITGGDFSRRVPITGSGDAFDGLGAQINLMLDRIVALMEELRLLTDSLAHDLRSPVGRLRARVDAALAAQDDTRREVLLAGVVAEADALMRMLTTVLEIGRSEAMASRNQFASLDPGALIAELAEMYEPLAEEAGAALTVETGAAIAPFSGHRQLLAQALSNLVDNALGYAAAGGEIRLFAEQRQGELWLGVADRGPGIAAADRQEARRRFGRLDGSRSASGAGLGLSLAEAVAHLHHGRLELGDNRPGLHAALVIPTGPIA
jgi:signal transduction histidine kinase